MKAKAAKPPPRTKPLRVLLADDSKILREKLAVLLSSLPAVEVVGEANDGIEALAAIGSLEPDLVVLDLRMPRMSGFEVLAALQPNPSRRRLIQGSSARPGGTFRLATTSPSNA